VKGRRGVHCQPQPREKKTRWRNKEGQCVTAYGRNKASICMRSLGDDSDLSAVSGDGESQLLVGVDDKHCAVSLHRGMNGITDSIERRDDGDMILQMGVVNSDNAGCVLRVEPKNATATVGFGNNSIKWLTSGKGVEFTVASDDEVKGRLDVAKGNQVVDVGCKKGKGMYSSLKSGTEVSESRFGK
jgi:hypothetical protein